MNPLFLLLAAGGAGYAISRSRKPTAETIPTGPAGPAPTGPSAQAGAPVSSPIVVPHVTSAPRVVAKPAASAGQPTLRLGATGPAVTSLQQWLNANGTTLATDGKFGPATLAAVKAFQKKRGLVVDGIVGPATWAALGSTPVTAPVVTPVLAPASGPPMVSPATMAPSGGAEMVQAGPGPTLRQGAKGAVVQYLQHLLNLHGTALKEDGVFGPGTAAAVKSYQAGHKLTVDGVVGPQTWTSLQA